jgi:hypothetical protein
MEPEYTHDLERLVTHGLETIDDQETVTVNLRDLVFVYATLLEFQRFFHQPLHYRRLDDVKAFLGSVDDKAGYALLSSAIHDKMQAMLPKHVERGYEDGVFESPCLPFYYDPSR